jgi:hypothetical protein
MLWLALEAVKLGTSVVVDYGCWSRDERSAIRWLAEAQDACFRIIYLPVSDETQRARTAHRWATAPEDTFPMTEADILDGRAHFEEPDAAELEGRRAAGPPPDWADWRAWPPTGGRRSRDCSWRLSTTSPRNSVSPHDLSGRYHADRVFRGAGPNQDQTVVTHTIGHCVTIGCPIRTNETHSSNRATSRARTTPGCRSCGWWT